eukprot:TRINITY_DN6504_c0_g1_i1.p1 TRINITY_DN6504_c0_g1~~TRINITY_DN6504_c0_g1_i1.p1  ORF type:complete len:128 (+),score=6.64 TRINITY_DN6504_c0_g1_i1:26-409(+)
MGTCSCKTCECTPGELDGGRWERPGGSPRADEGSKIISIEKEITIPGTSLRRFQKRTIRIGAANSFAEVSSLIYDLHPDTNKIFCITDRCNSVYLSSIHKSSYSYARLVNGATYKLEDYEGTASLRA